jgi:hypothetical protein
VANIFDAGRRPDIYVTDAILLQALLSLFLIGPVSRHVGRLVVSGLKPKTCELYVIAVWVVGGTATITNQIPLLLFLSGVSCLRRLCRAPGRARTPATPPTSRPRSPQYIWCIYTSIIYIYLSVSEHIYTHLGKVIIPDRFCG